MQTRTQQLWLRTAAGLLVASCAFAQDTPQPAQETSQQKWKFSWENRPALRFGDLLRLEFRGRFATDLRTAEAPLRFGNTSRFDIARRRIGVDGAIGRIADFQIEHELAEEGGWRDVYINYRQLDHLNVQAGHFKLPFGLDENTSSTNLDFVYRSRAATLSPGRDQGVMAHGRVGVLRYAGGVFLRDGDNGRPDDTPRIASGLTRAGRLLVDPFRSSDSVFEDLQAGVAFTSSDVRAGMTDFSGPTELRDPFFHPQFAVQGRRQRVGLEMRWRPGPFSVQSELVRVSSERRGQSVEDLDLPPLVGSAWYTQGTWVLTGEEKRKGADEPKRPLFAGGFGSVELAARFDAVRFSSGGDAPSRTGPRSETIGPLNDRAVTFGVNWSPNRWVRVQANVTRDTMSVAPSSFWSRVVRFRFAM